MRGDCRLCRILLLPLAQDAFEVRKPQINVRAVPQHRFRHLTLHDEQPLIIFSFGAFVHQAAQFIRLICVRHDVVQVVDAPPQKFGDGHRFGA